MAQDRKLQKLELTWVGKYDEQHPQLNRPKKRCFNN